MAKLYGKQLAKSHGVDVEHALYRKSGDWYHVLKEFPAALFDERGYLFFRSLEDYDAFIAGGTYDGVKQNVATNTLTIDGGISGHAGYVPFGSLFPDELPAFGTVIEGAKRQVTVNSYERDQSAKRRCIKKWGLGCAICQLNFSDVYGDHGAGFIHVHHLTPISSIGAEYRLAPERDLRPVCPNCHAMLHRREPPLSIEELRDIVSRKGRG